MPGSALIASRNNSHPQLGRDQLRKDLAYSSTPIKRYKSCTLSQESMRDCYERSPVHSAAGSTRRSAQSASIRTSYAQLSDRSFAHVAKDHSHRETTGSSPAKPE